MTPNRLYALILLAPILIINSTIPAHAQDKNKDGDPLEDSLNAVVVYGKSYRTTGTKSALSPMEAPMSYEIYDAELLQQRQADTVNKALRYVPGVTPESRSTVTIFDQYTIRGFQSYRNYYDGLPLQSNNLWNVVPQVDAFATDSIEVLKGPTSVLYGSAGPGGMINQVGKRPLAADQSLVRARSGTNRLHELAIDKSGAASDDLDYRVIALVRQRDGQMQTTEEERRIIAPSGSWRISGQTSLDFSLYYQDDPKMVPSTPLPATGTLYSASYGKLDSDAYAGDKNWGNFDREVTMLGYELNHEFNTALTFLQNFRYTDGKGLQRNTYNSGLTGGDRILNRNAYFTDEEIKGFTVDNQIAWDITSTDVSHKLLFGIDYQTLDSDVKYGDTLAGSAPTIDLGDPDYNQIDPATLAVNNYTEDHRIDQTQLGFYIQDEIQWQSLTLLANLRNDSYKSQDDADITGATSTSSTEIDQDETTGRLAFIYKLENGWAPYVSYAESYEPTSGTDTLSDKPFEPTTAKQLETGVKFKNPNNGSEFVATLFDIKQQNVVVNTADFLQKTQTGEVSSMGIELTLRTRLSDKLDLQASYNQQDVEVSKNPLDPSLVGNTPVWVAEKQASFWATYYLNESLDISLGARYVGASQLDAQNTDTLPSYTVADIAASYLINDGYRLGFTVSNLTDKRFVGACYDANNCWMGAERSAELSLNIDF